MASASFALADRIGVIEAGRLVACDRPAAVAAFKAESAKNVADFCLGLYARLGLLDGVRVVRSSDPAYLVSLLGTAARHKTRSRANYQKVFSVSAEVWKDSTALSLTSVVELAPADVRATDSILGPIAKVKGGAVDYIVKGPDYAANLTQAVLSCLERNGLRGELVVALPRGAQVLHERLAVFFRGVHHHVASRGGRDL